MDVHLEKENKLIKSNSKSVRDLLKELKLNPTTVLVSKNDELVTEDEELIEEDIIRILPVISGG